MRKKSAPRPSCSIIIIVAYGHSYRPYLIIVTVYIVTVLCRLFSMRYKRDTLGRAKFTEYTQNPIADFKPQKHHIVWMRFVQLHGPQSSHYLLQTTPKNEDNFSEQLKAVYDGGMFYKPAQQRETEYSHGHFHVYDLTEKGKDYLKKNGHWVDAVRPTGHWVHQFMVATITATIDIMCQRNGYTYIPPHEYLDGRPMGYDVSFEWDTEPAPLTVKLIPDAVFAIDYGNGSFIAYALEADRNTEPNKPTSWKRKSDLRSIRQYGNFLGKKLYKKAYNREAMMMLLYFTVSEVHASNFLEIAEKEWKNPHIGAVGVVDEFQKPFYPPKLLTHLFEEGLLKAGKEPFFIKKQI